MGENLVGGPTLTRKPGALNDTTGNHVPASAVQSLWSNAAVAGAGYCAGAGQDLPVPSAR